MSGNSTVLIAGAGNAALTAALSARDAGAGVCVLEAAPEASCGGNSRFVIGGFRFGFRVAEDVFELIPDLSAEERDLIRQHRYTPDDFVGTLMALSKGEADETLCRVLAEKSLPVLKWMRGKGVEWGLDISGIDPEQMWRSAPGNVYVKGRGPGLVRTLMDEAMKSGVEIRYGCELRRILLDHCGGVRGVIARCNDKDVEIGCRCLVMACGGFEANRAMRARHLGDVWSRMKVRGTAFNQGLGLQALFEAGAQQAGQWSNGHAVPIAADAPETGSFALGETTRRCLFQYGISVNKDGRRFMDEGADRKQFMYSMTGVAVASQGNGEAFQIFDKRFESSNFEQRFYRSGSYAVAETLDGLAGQIGVDAETLRAEVDRYNAAIISDARFNPGILDGSEAHGVAPARSNYAARISTPPFYAFRVCGGITFTFGGARIDAECRVLNADAAPIPGLFAAGEIAGGYFAHTYPANAGLMRGAVTGRISGANAANYTLRNGE